MWFKNTTIFLGSTVGQFIPWKCSQGHVNQVSRYYGNLVDGYTCPTCREESIQKEKLRIELKKKDDEHKEELNRKQRELEAKEQEVKKLEQKASFNEKKLSMSDYTKCFFEEFLQSGNMNLRMLREKKEFFK